MTDQPTADLIRAAIADAVTICNGPLIDHAATGVLYALGLAEFPPADGAPGPARRACCPERFGHAPNCPADQANPLPVSTCPRTDRHGYHMWPERPDAPAFCPGHPAPDSARTTAGNPATSSDTADNGPWRWAETIATHGSGDTYTIDIDIQQDDEEPVPFEIRLPDARILHAMLGDAIREGEPGHGSDDSRELAECGSSGGAASDDGLRDRYAAAIRQNVWIRLGPNVVPIAQESGSVPLNHEEADAAADAVLAVRDRRMEQLAAEQERYEEETVGRFNEQAIGLARRAETAEALVRDLAALLAGACWYDHHGYCQAHGWIAIEPRCPHARAKELLAALDGPNDTTPPAEPGHATVTIRIHAPNQANADRWAGYIRDLVTAEHGEHMRLDIRITPEAGE